MPVAAFEPESSSAAFLASKFESSRVPPRLKMKTQIFLGHRNILPHIFLQKNLALLTIPSTEKIQSEQLHLGEFIKA